jgi:hypothetical protein
MVGVAEDRIFKKALICRTAVVCGVAFGDGTGGGVDPSGLAT